MKYQINKNSGVKIRYIFENKDYDCRVIKYKRNNGSFKSNIGELYFHINLDTNEKYLLVGMGKEEKLNLDDVRYVSYLIGKKLIENKEYELEINMPKLNGLCNKQLAKSTVEGLMCAEYKFDKYFSNKDENKEFLLNYNPVLGKEDKVIQGIEESILLMESVNFSKELVNEPANVMTPKKLSELALERLNKNGVNVEIYDKDEIEKLNMKAFLEVARGSENEPKLIVLKYMNNSETKDVVALVGKGITYDTGGYSIKPTDGMKTMFCDMGGAATVLGAFDAISKAKLKVNVIGVIAACENMISGKAYKPGDIISSMKGKTIEIVNTDAEGRLTLADAIYYATSIENVVKVIDLATLTGACLVALGERYTGVVTNSDKFYNELEKASIIANEKIWKLPNDEYFRNMNKSNVADLKNSGGRLGGTISAGLFVSEFINGEKDWIHMDIAGTAYLSSPIKYMNQGATGIHVKTLYYLLKNEEKSSCMIDNNKNCGCGN